MSMSQTSAILVAECHRAFDSRVLVEAIEALRGEDPAPNYYGKREAERSPRELEAAKVKLITEINRRHSAGRLY